MPGIIGEDNRRPIDDRGYPWGAVGQINVAGFSRRGLCSGTLISPQIVMTAAHCVVDHVTGRPFRGRTIHFAAGVNRGKPISSAQAACVRLPASYDTSGPKRPTPDIPFQKIDIGRLTSDIAIVVLDRPLDVEPVKIHDGPSPENGTPVTFAAYFADRRQMLSGDSSCHLLAKNRDFWLTDCDSHIGGSGGPLLTKRDGFYFLGAISVASSKGEINYAVPASAAAGISMDPACP